MEEISIVRKRSRVWAIVLAILLLVAIVIAVLWFMGDQSRAASNLGDVIELGRRSISGTS